MCDLGSACLSNHQNKSQCSTSITTNSFPQVNIPQSVTMIKKQQFALGEAVNPSGDPFLRISNISFEDYVFRKITSKELKLTSIIAHYFYCKNPACGAGLVVKWNQNTNDVQFIQPEGKKIHLVTCAKINIVTKDKIKKDLENLRAYSIELYEKNHLTVNNRILIANILEVYASHQYNNKQCPLPVVSKNTIRNWFHDAFPLPAAEMLKSIIPIELRIINGSTWIFLESRTDHVKIYLSSNL